MLAPYSPSQKDLNNLQHLQQARDIIGIYDQQVKSHRIKQLRPGNAANKYYDKNLISALDKYRAQEVHIKHLKEFQRDIEKMKCPPPTNGIKFNVDEKNEIRKMNMLRNRI